MSIPDRFDARLNDENGVYQLNFVKGKHSNLNIKIGQDLFSIINVKEEQVKNVAKILNSLASEPILNLDQLKHRIAGRGEIHLPAALKADSIGISQLRTLPDSNTVLQETLDYAKKLEQTNLFSGVLLVASGDQIHLHKAIVGAEQIPFNRTTPFNSLSIGKLFTSIALMQLIERSNGKINLDDPVHTYLTNDDYLLTGADPIYVRDRLADADLEAFRANNKITLRHLLTHRGGIVENPGSCRFDDNQIGKDHYSNYGFQLLGRVIQNISEQPFQEYIRENIFTDPNTHEVLMPGAIKCLDKPPGASQQPSRFEVLPSGKPYRIGPAIKPLPGPDGNGCWWLTALDLQKFALAFSSRKYLSKEGQRQLLTPLPNTTQGLGFRTERHPNMYHHPGGADGISSGLLVLEGDPPTIVVCMSNYNIGNMIIPDIMDIASGKKIANPLEYFAHLKTVYASLAECEPAQKGKIKAIIAGSGIQSMEAFEKIAEELALQPAKRGLAVAIREAANLVFKAKAKNAPRASEWVEKEKADLPAHREMIAKKYWKDFVLKTVNKNHADLKHFLAETSPNPSLTERRFDRAMKEKNFLLFLSVFKHLTPEQVFQVNDGEQLNAIPIPVTHEMRTITPKDLKNLKEYMDETIFSGVVTLSDSRSTYTITSKKFNGTTPPFAIHSVGKVFTGALVLQLVRKGILSREILDEPIELDPKVKAALPPAVKAHLSKTTLHQVMLHEGDYGDYLGKYIEAINKALQAGLPPPKMERPEDFLRFADGKIVKNRYSNLGILLVALSIQHHVKVPFDELLKKHILDPAGVELSIVRPNGGVFNEEDPVAGHIAGSPAGGYWMSPHDLNAFGRWFNQQCLSDREFMGLAEQYGGEFYQKGERMMSHAGMIDSATAHFATYLDNGVTVSILSDQGQLSATRLHRAICEHMLAA